MNQSPPFSTTPFEHDLRLYYRHKSRARTVTDFAGTDTKRLFMQNMEDVKNRPLLQQLGWDRPGVISYQYNSEGFRDQEFDERPCGLALGDSFTEGVGIDEISTWPRQLSAITGLYFWNLGLGGTCFDTIYRLFEHFVDRLRPKLVVICHPPHDRFEYADSSTTIAIAHAWHHDWIPPMYQPFIKNYFAEDFNSILNAEKNVRLLELISAKRGLPLFHYDNLRGLELASVGYAAARDLLHSGRQANLEFAQWIAKDIENKY